jgi:DNA repair exonuclease SbcCD ATPase subunit
MIQKEWEQTDKLVISLEKKCSGFEKEVNDLNYQLASSISSSSGNDCDSTLEKELEDKIRVLEKQVEDLQYQLSNTDQSSADVQEEYEIALQKMNGEVVDLQQTLSKADERAVELNNMLNTMKEQRECSEKICASLEQDNSELSANLNSISAEKDKLSEKVKKLTLEQQGAETCSIEEKKILIAELNKMMENLMETEARCNTFEAEAKTYRQQLSDYDKQSARDQELIMEAANAEMESLRSNSLKTENQLNEKCRLLEEEVESLKQQLSQSTLSSSKASREILRQLQDTQVDLEESTASCIKMQDEILSMRKGFEETLSLKEKRIAHLEQSKLTQDQMEKIKTLKNERKKYHDECKVLKKQLIQLKSAYDDLQSSRSASTAAAASLSADQQVSSQAALETLQSKKSDSVRPYF